MLLVGSLLLASAVYLERWYQGRSAPVDRELFPGVRHVRTALREPREVVINLLFVDLTSPIEFQITKPSAEKHPKVNAATTAAFLQDANVQVAMNANFFHPFHSNSPWNYYPRAGDPVEVLGHAASSGNVYSKQIWAGATLFISRENRVQLGGNIAEIWNAVAGDQWLVRDGAIVAEADSFGIYPRAAAAMNETGNLLILAVVDGKQPHFSMGMTLPELGAFLKARGAHHAINLDGGGSVTMVAESARGNPVTLNSPIHTRIPGRQRPVANHIGIRAATN